MCAQEVRCFRCGRRVGADERACDSCGAGLLVDVIVDTVPDEPRQAYLAARALSELDEPALPLAEVKRRLAAPPATVVAGCTRAFAATVRQALQEHGLRSRVNPTSQPAPGRRGGPPAGPRSAAARLAALVRAHPLAVAGALAAVLLVGAILAVVRGSSAARSPAAELSSRDLALAATRASVQLRCSSRRGTGFFVREDLLITTAQLIGDGGSEINVLLQDGRVLRGRPERSDPWFDVAVVRVPGAARLPLELGDATLLQLGDPILVTGKPVGLELAVSKGIVAHPAQARMGIPYLQVDAGSAGGGAGGPVLDRGGRLVGMVAGAHPGSAGSTLALPVNYLYSGAEPLLERQRTSGEQARWNRLVVAAAQQEQDELDQVLAATGKPALVAADLVSPGMAQVTVVRPADATSGLGRLTFELERNGAPLCSVTGRIDLWQPTPPAAETIRRSRYLMWLDRHQQLDHLQAAIIPLDLAGCPAAQQLADTMLHQPGADPRADRVPLRAR